MSFPLAKKPLDVFQLFGTELGDRFIEGRGVFPDQRTGLDEGDHLLLVEVSRQVHHSMPLAGHRHHATQMALDERSATIPVGEFGETIALLFGECCDEGVEILVDHLLEMFTFLCRR